jgi:mono/diheme cytochrome c family protein
MANKARALPAYVLLGACAFSSMAPSAATAAIDEQQVDLGRRLYQQNCAACHGEKGEGQPEWEKRNSLGELPAPPHGPEGHTWKHADGMLYRIIRDGWRDPFNKTERQTMPAFRGVLSPAEIRAVVDYLKTMWTPEQQQIQREESRRAPFPSEAGAGAEQSAATK